MSNPPLPEKTSEQVPPRGQGWPPETAKAPAGFFAKMAAIKAQMPDASLRDRLIEYARANWFN